MSQRKNLGFSLSIYAWRCTLVFCLERQSILYILSRQHHEFKNKQIKSKTFEQNQKFLNSLLRQEGKRATGGTSQAREKHALQARVYLTCIAAIASLSLLCQLKQCMAFYNVLTRNQPLRVWPLISNSKISLAPFHRYNKLDTLIQSQNPVTLTRFAQKKHVGSCMAIEIRFAHICLLL